MNDLKKYKISDDEIYTDKEFKLIKRSGISKIKRIDCIMIDMHVEKIQEETFNNKSDYAVFMSGTGTIYNSRGLVINRIQSFASATPKNCQFDYKLEVCEKRLESRLVCELAGLDGWMGEDEVAIAKDKTSSRSTKGNKALELALAKLQDQKEK
jgi:hypothetical protein